MADDRGYLIDRPKMLVALLCACVERLGGAVELTWDEIEAGTGILYKKNTDEKVCLLYERDRVSPKPEMKDEKPSRPGPLPGTKPTG